MAPTGSHVGMPKSMIRAASRDDARRRQAAGNMPQSPHERAW